MWRCDGCCRLLYRSRQSLPDDDDGDDDVNDDDDYDDGCDDEDIYKCW